MFDDDELNIIYQDQIDALINEHEGDACEHVQDCPLDHFVHADPYEVEDRQSIMKKILEKAGEF